MKKLAKLFVLMGSVAVISTGALAEGDPVKERKELMKAIGGSMKTAATMLKGAQDYDAAKAEAAMKTISESVVKFATLMKDGTDMSKDTRSEASPKIWENKDDFAKQIDLLKVAALSAADAAKAGKDKLAPEFGKVGATCGTCHKAYRVKK